MMYLVGTMIFILLLVIIVQVGNIMQSARRLRGEEQVQKDVNEFQARMMLVFLVGFMAFAIGSSVYYYDMLIGYGPNRIPTEHGRAVNSVLNVTIFFTGIVFVLTHIALFWFSYKFREKEGQMAKFVPHNNTLEVIWTVAPAVVMSILVVSGLMVWNDAMADVTEDDQAVGYVTGAENEYIEIGATGMQFNWVIRHPGPDGLLGEKNYKEIGPTNQVGQVWSDPKNIDDIIVDEIVIPVNTTIRARISSRDVLHNFDIPHFYVKMDAVPGMPTYFKFKCDETTEQYRERLSQHPDWQVPADPSEPDGKQRWETFNFELACAELCGKSHYSMRKAVRVVTQEEYNQWLQENEEKSLYLQEIRGTDEDPFLNKELLTIEKRIADRKAAAEAPKEVPATQEEGDATEATDAEGQPEGNGTETQGN